MNLLGNKNLVTLTKTTITLHLSYNRIFGIIAYILSFKYIHLYRSHFLDLTLYLLVVLILTISQIIFTLRKRKFQARIKTALIEIEDILHKWRTAEKLLTSDDHTQSYCILQSLVALPASPVEHSITTPFHFSIEEHQPSHPIVFYLDMSNEQPSGGFRGGRWGRPPLPSRKNFRFFPAKANENEFLPPRTVLKK
jgi:hypothetical protein